MTAASDTELKKGFAGVHNLWSDQQFAAAQALLKRMVDKKLEVVRISFVRSAWGFARKNDHGLGLEKRPARGDHHDLLHAFQRHLS